MVAVMYCTQKKHVYSMVLVCVRSHAEGVITVGHMADPGVNWFLLSVVHNC